MAKKDNRTMELFEIPQAPEPYPGSMDYRMEVSYIVAQILKDYPYDRHRLAAEVSRLSGINVSKAMLDGYAAESRETFNIPFWLVPVIEEAASSHLFTNWLVKKRGGRVLFGKDSLKAEIGQLELKRKKAIEKIDQLTARMNEHE